MGRGARGGFPELQPAGLRGEVGAHLCRAQPAAFLGCLASSPDPKPSTLDRPLRATWSTSCPFRLSFFPVRSKKPSGRRIRAASVPAVTVPAVSWWAGRRGAESRAQVPLPLHRCFFSELDLAAVDGELRFSSRAHRYNIFQPSTPPGAAVC